ncbi:GntR family transcriptional regulator [Branchiibius hedensis]|uniref:DNA-binding transcriptional regulator, GntR family n=1 Tax=Branchiibius hedensis TaxID=672460 RepID=A0A2Y8ZVR2_9MICO|nr:GntR family transcriptional regulator [Branchiibius hedensis]PWJ26815.1 GntR family transcriptional regulator [Branchiibius hedensis]SSA35626.1 DNA-binding transcriptional regulator, GntR family [Branchiibius hedensis]
MARSAVSGAAAQTKSQRAYEWIRERIVNQHFTPGYRLVLGTIAAELDMSMVPVREAVRQLEAEGLVTFEPNVGARVAMIDDTEYRYAMQAVTILESAATALAARSLTVDDLRRARSINELMVESLDRFDPRIFSTLNQEFHAILYSKCTNPRLLEILNTEWARLGHMRDSIFAFVPERSRESVREHEDIVALIERGASLHDIEEAVRLHRSGTLRAYMTHEHPGETLGQLII